AAPWTDSRELVDQMLVYLASVLRSIDPKKRPFTVVRPNDSHTLLLNAVDLMHTALRTSSSRLVPAIPALLSLLTMQLYRTVHVIWQQSGRSRLRMGVEVWPFTLANIEGTFH